MSHVANTYVIDSNYNNTEVPADLPEEQASQSSVKVVAARSKAKAKPQKRETVELPSTIPMNERKWIDIEPGESSPSLRTRSRRQSSIFFDIVKRYNEKMTEQFNSGESSFIFGINFHKTNIGRMIGGKHAWQQEEGSKRRYQYCSDISGTIFYLRALQRHSGRSLIDPSLQDNVIIQCGLFQHIYHIGCAFDLHSIINNGLILEVRIQARDKQYSSCLLIQETKNTKILNILPSLYHVEHSTCTVLGRNIKTRYFGLILILRFEKD